MGRIDWALVDWASVTPIAVGDRVSTEAGGLPIFEVQRIAGDRAWLRDVQTGRDHVAAKRQLRWKAHLCG